MYISIYERPRGVGEAGRTLLSTLSRSFGRRACVFPRARARAFPRVSTIARYIVAVISVIAGVTSTYRRLRSFDCELGDDLSLSPSFSLPPTRTLSLSLSLSPFLCELNSTADQLRDSSATDGTFAMYFEIQTADGLFLFPTSIVPPPHLASRAPSGRLHF